MDKTAEKCRQNYYLTETFRFFFFSPPIFLFPFNKLHPRLILKRTLEKHGISSS